MAPPPTFVDAPSGPSEPGDDGWSDQHFLEMAQNGRRGCAYECLLHLGLGRLRGYLRARFHSELGGKFGIEELLHEVAWKAVECVGSYRPENGCVRAWAFWIGVNLAIDRVRSEAARRSREEDAARSRVASVDHQRVMDAIQALPAPYRDVLLLDLEHGGTAPGRLLAEHFGVARQTIYNWRNEARQQLFRSLR